MMSTVYPKACARCTTAPRKSGRGGGLRAEWQKGRKTLPCLDRTTATRIGRRWQFDEPPMGLRRRQRQAPRFDHRLGARADAELAQDHRDVRLHRRLADAEL